MLRGSVQVRLSIIIVAVTTLILCGYTAFDYMNKKKIMMGDLKDHVDITSERLGKALVDPLWNIDKKAIDGIIMSEMTEKDMFAVVISEGKDDKILKAVNPAMRAAEAAKNTAGLIEGTVKRIMEGSEVVQKTDTEFSELQISSAGMAELMGESHILGCLGAMRIPYLFIYHRNALCRFLS